MGTTTPVTHHLTVLTGASRGIGRALAEALLREGAPQHVLCMARHPHAPLVELAQAHGSVLTSWAVDLAQPHAVAARLREWLAAQDAPALAGATLINNAGIVAPPLPLEAAQDADVTQVLRVGLEAPMLLTGAFLHATREWRAVRKVLNISSGLGRRAIASQAPYCAAKAGLDHFSRAVALEQAALPNGARIVSLAPGVIDTDMQVQLRGGAPEQFPDHERFVQLKAQGQLDSPAAAAGKLLRYLARPDFGDSPVADVRDA